MFLAAASSLFASDPLGLVLPTDNDAIFSADPSNFYMYTDRNFEGVTSKPWEGGQYGFSRDQKRTSIGIIYTRLHEGIDIRPVKRDASGNPLDEVRAIAAGTVVYVSASAGESNYGRYLVVHHDWGDGPFFSLYAHLSKTLATLGQRVAGGETIAVMGYTGAGINRERSHVHVELNFILSDRFQVWYGKHFTTANHHGIYNGFNLTGLDIAGLLKAHRANPAISIPQFLREKEEVYYKVAIPAKGPLSLLQRYPWLGEGEAPSGKPGNWEIAFNDKGVPLAVRAGEKKINGPVVTYVKPSGTDHSYLTVGRITGSGNSATLTPTGSRYVQLITDSF
jgi:murein DD-endopeptidase MepM/ murein hydrolase activator NlpD